MKKYGHKDPVARVNNVEWFKLKEDKKTYLVSKDGRVGKI